MKKKKKLLIFDPWLHIFLTLYVKIRKPKESTSSYWSPVDTSGKSTPVIDGVELNSLFFFTEHHFHFKEWMTDKLGLFIPELLAFFTSKWMMWTWALHGKEMTKFVTNNKIKIKILENCIHNCELDSFTIPSPGEIDDAINVCGFWNYIMKCINIWHNPVKKCFPNNQCMILEHHTRIEDLFKIQHKGMGYNVTEYEKFY